MAKTKTDIKIGVERTIKTAEFEGLRVHSEISESIEWGSEAEREAEMKKVVDHLMSDFKKGYETMVASVGVNRSLATGTHKKSDGSTKVGNVVSGKSENLGEIDIF